MSRSFARRQILSKHRRRARGLLTALGDDGNTVFGGVPLFARQISTSCPVTVRHS
ncbi:hypothetical protein ACIBCO_15825 [Streptomyces violascens]|uniref:hypothetical protein n=1 Tax=Streptomyces violascens TaxID=67381 RepID=UPI0037AF03FE